MMTGGVQSRERTGGAGPPADGELDFSAVGRALWRKKLWVLIPAALAAAIAFAAVNIMTPRYKSEARLIIETRENVFMRPAAERDAMRERVAIDQEAVNSQVQLALSREVARPVIRELKLSERPEFDPALSGVGRVRQLLIMLGIARDPLRMTPEERLFESYYARVQAYQVEKSRVIAIEFQSADPELAARGANAVAESYLSVLQSVKQDQTRAASTWLAGEIETLRDKVSEAEAKVEQFRAKSNLFVGSNNNTLSNQTLGEVNSQLAVARAQKAEADAKAQAIRDMLRSGRPIESNEVINSELIRRLNEQRVTLLAQLAEQSSTLLGNHPRIKELRAQIADLERQIRSEAERIVRSLENDARISGARVEQLSKNLEQLKLQAASTNEQDVQLRALEREAKAQRDLLESYLAKYREATARETIGASPADARIISRAIVSNTPYFPKKLPIVLIATLATLLLAAGFITTGELLGGNVYRPAIDPTVRDPASAARVYFNRPDPTRRSADMLTLERADAQITQDQSLAAAAERLREYAGGRSRTVVAGVGPNVETAAVASALAQKLAQGARAVRIDLSFAGEASERPVADHGRKGISDLVRGKASFGEIIARDATSRAHVIAAGGADGEAASVLQSERLSIALDALERAYEHVVIDLGALPDVVDERMARLAPYAVLVSTDGTGEAARAAEQSLRTAGCLEVLMVSSTTDAGETSTSSPAAAA